MLPVSRWSVAITMAILVAFLSIGWLPTADARFTVTKCCPAGEAFELNQGCFSKNQTEGGKTLEFKIPKILNESGAFNFYNADEYTLRYEMPKCEDTLHLIPKNGESFNITEKGHIQTNHGNFPSEEYDYCFEELLEDGEFFYAAFFCPVEPPCAPGDLRDDCPCMPGIYNEKCPQPSVPSTLIFMAISLLFLASTFIVYAVNNELQNVHGKSLMCHVASLFLAYSVFIYNQYLTSSIVEISAHCIWISYIQQFAFIATFFWLNVMCFEIWWNFRRLKVNSKEYEKKKFIIYSIYAWGCSIIILIFTFIMETYTTLDVRPKFGHRKCWFESRPAQLLFFYGPISIILFSNLLMSIHTIIMIIKQTKYAKVFNESERRKENQEKENVKFILYLTLFIVMGLNWIIEVILWATEASGYFWTVIDIGNALQGLFIFIIFVCNKPVLRLLNQKLCPQFQLIKPSSVTSIRNSIDNTVI